LRLLPSRSAFELPQEQSADVLRHDGDEGKECGANDTVSKHKDVEVPTHHGDYEDSPKRVMAMVLPWESQVPIVFAKSLDLLKDL